MWCVYLKDGGELVEHDGKAQDGFLRVVVVEQGLDQCRRKTSKPIGGVTEQVEALKRVTFFGKETH